jgi:hypothetical protein
MNRITELYEKSLGWYKQLPTWKKVVFFVVVPVLILLGALYFVITGKEEGLLEQQEQVSSKADQYIKKMTDNTVATHKATQKKLETDLLVKKTEAVQLANEKIKIEKNRETLTTAISNAESFEEVDTLMKGIKK